MSSKKHILKWYIIGSTFILTMGRRNIILNGAGRRETVADVWVPDGNESRVIMYLNEAHPGWRYPIRTDASLSHESSFNLAIESPIGLEQVTKLRKRAERSLIKLDLLNGIKRKK